MPKSHVPYPPEFRQQMIELVRAGRNPHELANEFKCSAQTIRNWVAQSAIDSGKPLPGKDGLTTAEREELTRLRRQGKRSPRTALNAAARAATMASTNSAWTPSWKHRKASSSTAWCGSTQ